MQAAGGNANRIAQLIAGTARDAVPLEHELISLARKSCEKPAVLECSDLEPIRQIVGNDALDYALVIGGFHFVNRIADLLDVSQEFLPGSLRRFEILRRMTVRLGSFVMAKMDLTNRAYAFSFEDAINSLRPYFGTEARRTLTDQLEPLETRPKLIEALRLMLEEREKRSSLEHATVLKVNYIVESALPASAQEAKEFDSPSADPIEALAFVGTRGAYRTSKEMIDALRHSGFDDLKILDLATAIADSNMWARIYRLAGLAPELYYLTGK